MKGYGVLELTIASPAQTLSQPVTLGEAKDYMRITETTPADTSQNAIIEEMISAAREIAEIEQGTDLIEKQWDLHLDLMVGREAADALQLRSYRSIHDFGSKIQLRYPLQSVDLFQHTDNNGVVTTLIENTDYRVDTHRSLVTPPWGSMWPFYTPDVSSSVLIRFTSGYPATHPFWTGGAGQRIKKAIKEVVAGWYEQRIPYVQGSVQEQPFGAGRLLGYGMRPRVF